MAGVLSFQASAQGAAHAGSKPSLHHALQDTSYFVVAEQMPAPVGGMAAIQKKIHYPEIVKRAGIQGTVYVRAFVDEQGNVNKTEIVNGVHPALDEVAVKAVKETKFKPGMQQGKPIKVIVAIPIRFRLNDKGKTMKNSLYPGNYPTKAGGIEVPATAHWKAMNVDAQKDKVLLVLQDEWSKSDGFWSVMSYLTPEEALELSQQLQKAAAEAKKGR